MSSLHDLEHRRPLEIEETLGYVVTQAVTMGLTVPTVGHVLPPHAWPQSMHAAREWVTMLALWSRRHLSGYGADTFQGPLVPHCRFQRWRTISVRVFGVVHVNDSVETHRPRPSRTADTAEIGYPLL